MTKTTKVAVVRVRLEAETHSRIMDVAAAGGQSVSEWIRVAVLRDLRTRRPCPVCTGSGIASPSIRRRRRTRRRLIG